MNKGLQFCVLMLISCFIAACNNDNKPVGNVAVTRKKPELTQPFHYHKLIEVSPGQDYDILSWGRGSSAAGAFEILHSDSSARKFTTTTGDLDGTIVDVYNSDMDLDGNPEIIIQAKGADSVNFTHIYAFEFNNEKAEKLDFPKLTRSQKEGYRGNDNFYIKDGILMREFPVYDGSGNDAKPTAQKRLLQYGLRNNSFTVKQLSTDSANTIKSKPARSAASEPATSKAGVKSASSAKTGSHKDHTETHSKKKRKHSSEHKHRRRHHRRHYHSSDDE